jgi:hypothetical protein
VVAAPGSWTTTAVGPFVLVTHPETRVARADDGERVTVSLGDAFFTVDRSSGHRWRPSQPPTTTRFRHSSIS